LSKPEAEKTAVTAASVAATLGFPADRKEVSPAPTGWQHSVTDGKFEHVSRETLGDK
jgi:hypothetical protein